MDRRFFPDLFKKKEKFGHEFEICSFDLMYLPSCNGAVPTSLTFMSSFAILLPRVLPRAFCHEFYQTFAVSFTTRYATRFAASYATLLPFFKTWTSLFAMPPRGL
jgi:hypothetical protein